MIGKMTVHGYDCSGMRGFLWVNFLAHSDIKGGLASFDVFAMWKFN